MHHKLAWKSWWLQGRDSEEGQLQVLTIKLFLPIEFMFWIFVALRASIVWLFVVLFGDVIWEYLIASYTKTIVTMKVEKTVPATKNRGGWSFREKVSPQADWVVAECQTRPSIPGHKVLKHDALHCTRYAFDMVEMAEICFWHGWNDTDMLLTSMKWQRYIWGWFTCALGDLRTLTATQTPPEENIYSCFYPCDAEHV